MQRDASMLRPRGIAVDAKGSVFIAETNSFRIRLWNATRREYYTFAGSAVQGYAGDGGAATAARVNYPSTVALDLFRNALLIADSGNNRIRSVNLRTGIITLVAGNGVKATTGNGGAATAASFNNPRGVVADAAGVIYVSEFAGHVVRRIAATGTRVVTTIVGTGTAGFSALEVAATAARLNSPGELALRTGASPALIIADSSNYAVRQLTFSTGRLSTIAGTGVKGFSTDGTAATSARLTRVMGVAVDFEGTVHLSDSGVTTPDNGGNNCVRAITRDGRLKTVAGICNAPSPHKFESDMPATAVELDEPNGLAFAPPASKSRRLYIASLGHNAIMAVAIRPTPSRTPKPRL